MARPPKEYQAFTSLVDRLLKAPKDEVLRRVEKEKAASAANPCKRGPSAVPQPQASVYGGVPALSGPIKELRQAVQRCRPQARH